MLASAIIESFILSTWSKTAFICWRSDTGARFTDQLDPTRVAAMERSRRDASDIDGQTERSNGTFGKSDIEGKTAVGSGENGAS